MMTLISCSGIKRIDNGKDTVEFGSAENSTNLEINENSNIEYGPSIGGEQNVESGESDSGGAEPLIALVLYPSLYSTLSYIDLLYELEEQKVKVPIISSSGLGAVIVALYGLKKSLSYMEWKLFAILKQLKGVPPHTRQWYEVLNAFIDKEFGSIKLEQLKISLMIPFVEKNGNIKLVKTGELRKLLKKTLDISDASNFYFSPKSYRDEFKKFGVDDVFEVMQYAPAYQLKYTNEYYWGIFTSYISQIEKIPNILKVIARSNISIDELKPISEIRENRIDSQRDIADQIREKVEEHRESKLKK